MNRLFQINKKRLLIMLCFTIVAILYFLPLDTVGQKFKVSQSMPRVDTLSLVDFNPDKARDTYPFYGLASYYNSISNYLVDSSGVRRIDSIAKIQPKEGQWLAVEGRFKVILLKGQASSIDIHHAKGLLVNKTELSFVAPVLDQLRYIHLWPWLAALSRLVEKSLTWIQFHVVSNWGVTIILFALLIKIVFLPINILTIRAQRRVSEIQAILQPKHDYIKKHYDGEEAHNHLMKSYREVGVSPFYTLKPMITSLIQIPILIAVFNALGEMAQLDGAHFLWITNLAYPDSVGIMPFAIPLIGTQISLLPFFMTAITIFSTISFKNRVAPLSELRRQKRNLYLMAALFFVLFYPFPAAMVLYWAMTNVLQAIQQQILKV